MRNTEEGKVPYFKKFVYMRKLVNSKALHKCEESGAQVNTVGSHRGVLVGETDMILQREA